MHRSLLPAVALAVCAGAAQAQYVRGVNISGAEFGNGNIPGTFGTDYTFQSAPTFNYFSARGLNVMRIEVLWERLQAAPHGPLAAGNPNDYLGRLKQDVAWAKAAGAKVSIVLQNYGRYTVNHTQCVLDNPCGTGGTVQVTGADLADLWSKMAAVFKDEDAVFAYDIMNEPHDMGVANWNQISQQVVNAIRLVDSNKLIMVPGNSWSNATGWAQYNGATSWISDPAGNFWYEAHEYFDLDYSGTYTLSYDEELAGNPDIENIGVTRLAPFTQWCVTNNVKCYVGEYGIPNAGPAANGVMPDARWLKVLDNFLTALDAAGLPGTYWAAGEWWHDYPLSIQPVGFAQDREQLQTLLDHLQPDLLRTASAAASYGYNVAPNSLVAGYGHQLAPGVDSATTTPLPTKIGDTEVRVIDSAGATAMAPLLYVSGRQINYVVPMGAAAGLAKVNVLDQGATVSSGIVLVTPTAPGMFSANSDGQGIAAGYIQRVKSDGTVTDPELIFQYDASQGKRVAVPISFNGDKVILEMFGTGFDTATRSDAQVMVGSGFVTVDYAGIQGTYVGEDQINVELPNSLAGAGEVTVQVWIQGIPANPVTVTFQ